MADCQGVPTGQLREEIVVVGAWAWERVVVQVDVGQSHCGLEISLIIGRVVYEAKNWVIAQNCSFVGWELKNICVEITAIEAWNVGHVIGVADVELRGKSEHRQLELHDGHAIPQGVGSELADPRDLVVTTDRLSLECLGHGSVHP
jgi:hypothetical protein